MKFVRDNDDVQWRGNRYDFEFETGVSFRSVIFCTYVGNSSQSVLTPLARNNHKTRSLLSPSPVSEFLVLAHAVGPTPARDCLMLPLKKLACGWCGHSN